MAGVGGFMPFRCHLGGQQSDNNQSALCLYGSICEVVNDANASASYEYCNCPSGYIHDFTYGHFPNCGLPIFALPVMAGALTVVTSLVLAFSYPVVWELKSAARRMLVLPMINCVFGWLVFLGLWFQQGRFEAAIILLFFFNMVLTRTQIESTTSILRPMLMTLKHNIQAIDRILMTFEFFDFLGQLTLIILMCLYAHDADPNRYNSTVVVFQFWLGLNGFSLGVATIVACMYLKTAVDTGPLSKEDAKMNAFSDRLEGVKKSNYAICMFSMVLCGCPIVSLILGSFPGQYILVFLTHASLPLFTLNVGQILRLEEIKANASLRNSKRGGVGPLPADERSKHSSYRLQAVPSSGNVLERTASSTT